MFGFVIVLVAAVAVGVLVYRLTDAPRPAEVEPRTLPAEPPAAGGDLSDQAQAEPSEPAPSDVERYLQLDARGPTWHARLAGAMGLVIAVAAGAVVLALSLYALGSLLARLFSSAAGSAGAP